MCRSHGWENSIKPLTYRDENPRIWVLRYCFEIKKDRNHNPCVTLTIKFASVAVPSHYAFAADSAAAVGQFQKIQSKSMGQNCPTFPLSIGVNLFIQVRPGAPSTLSNIIR